MKKLSLLLFCFTCSIAIQAQGTLYKDSRAWSILSLLMGETVEKTKTLITGSGMQFSQKQKGDDGLDSYSYVALNSPDPDYMLPYFLFFTGDKSVAVFISYIYTAEEMNTVLLQDLKQLMDHMRLGGYTLTETKKEMLSHAFGDDSELFIYFFKSRDHEARIYHDVGMATFNLTIGNTQYQELLNNH